MDLHNGLDIEVYDVRPADLHYYYYIFNSLIMLKKV